MVYTAAQSIKTVLSELPGQPRTQVGFLTFDSSIHFYSLKASLSAPQMLVSSDLSDIVLPLPEDIVVNLQVLQCAFPTSCKVLDCNSLNIDLTYLDFNMSILLLFSIFLYCSRYCVFLFQV